MESQLAITTINLVKDSLIRNAETIACAESVTAGHLQVALSLADNAMDYFQGGITAYNGGQKTKHLGIDPIHAEKDNCVSRQVAEQMALGVSTMFNADYGVSITGYASPVPEEGVLELFAYCAVAYKGKVCLHEKLRTDAGNPVSARIDFTNQILQLLLQVVQRNPQPVI
ncbi:nicotinamide-nucleotide amidase [Chitinophaga skermanii]|uniref:Nicotinamide-nucleotide amidase n=1 Tax=Chitinophaga skermanii TaxID=331697 RepID=A0A327R1H0_9BACT|nr:nicotinamide-nucleotide amidohydrolase family protein [Chitinophaga skermanii]RAJ10699.1 nicotinamide-nucleotide amidase [Chitinophaga skermanii]